MRLYITISLGQRRLPLSGLSLVAHCAPDCYHSMNVSFAYFRGFPKAYFCFKAKVLEESPLSLQRERVQS